MLHLIYLIVVLSLNIHQLIVKEKWSDIKMFNYNNSNNKKIFKHLLILIENVIKK